MSNSNDDDDWDQDPPDEWTNQHRPSRWEDEDEEGEEPDVPQFEGDNYANDPRSEEQLEAYRVEMEERERDRQEALEDEREYVRDQLRGELEEDEPLPGLMANDDGIDNEEDDEIIGELDEQEDDGLIQVNPEEEDWE